MQSQFIFALVYVCAHLALYSAHLRTSRSFLKERNIFAFHAASFALLGVILLGWLLFDPKADAFAGVIAGLSLHAIYSLSFLELWALWDGGISIRILLAARQSAAPTVATILASHAQLSETKKHQRVRSLVGLDLIRENDGRYLLTRRGKMVAAILACIARNTAVRDVG
jgi:hypothetical protein